MAVVIQDNFNLAAAKGVDNRYGAINGTGQMIPYTSTAAALSAIPLVYRHLGLTVLVTDGGVNKEYWFKDSTSTLVEKASGIGQTLTTNTTININGNTFCIRDAGATCTPVSPTGFCIVPGCDAKTSDLNWNLNTNTFDGKNVFNSFSWFKQNVGIGSRPQPTTSTIVTNNSALYVTRASGYSNDPLCVTSENVLVMTASGIGNTSIYSGEFSGLRWTPSTVQTLTNSYSYSGDFSYLILNNITATTTAGDADKLSGTPLSSGAAQILAEAPFSFVANVNISNTAVLTVSASDITSFSPGYLVLLKSSTNATVFGGNINVYVNTVNTGTNTVTLKTYGGTPITSATAQTGATLVVSKNGGSISKMAGFRIKSPVSSLYAGSFLSIDENIGLEINNQRPTWNPSIDIQSATIANSYGIKQIGELDKNLSLIHI